jgi:hypothetical protein
MINVTELLGTLLAIPEADRDYIYVYTDDLKIVRNIEYDESATCSGGLIVTV